MVKLVGIITDLTVFGFWISIVGSPQVAKTVIGLILGFGVSFYYL